MAYLLFRVQVNYLKGTVFFFRFAYQRNLVRLDGSAVQFTLPGVACAAFCSGRAVIPGLGADERHNLSTNFPHCR